MTGPALVLGAAFLSVPLWWDIRPRVMFADQCSDPVGVISTISRMHCSGLQACQEVSGKLVVVGFARREREPDRQPVAVDHGLNLAGQPPRDRPMDCLL